jgi:hypothetical protein
MQPPIRSSARSIKPRRRSVIRVGLRHSRRGSRLKRCPGHGPSVSASISWSTRACAAESLIWFADCRYRAGITKRWSPSAREYSGSSCSLVKSIFRTGPPPYDVTPAIRVRHMLRNHVLPRRQTSVIVDPAPHVAPGRAPIPGGFEIPASSAIILRGVTLEAPGEGHGL